MGTRENKVEKYLKEQVELVFNGECRKWVSPGRTGVHDQILFIKGLPVIFVEVKTTGKDSKHSPRQKRENNCLQNVGSISIFQTVRGCQGVDALIDCLRDCDS